GTKTDLRRFRVRSAGGDGGARTGQRALGFARLARRGRALARASLRALTRRPARDTREPRRLAQTARAGAHAHRTRSKTADHTAQQQATFSTCAQHAPHATRTAQRTKNNLRWTSNS